jgi:antitoxin component HigA of HigAB toxin-antitoxin module
LRPMKRTRGAGGNDRPDPETQSGMSSVEELLQTEEGRCEFAKEELAFDATELIADLMERTQVNKSELAKRTGKSKAYITQVLSGSRNLTMHTLAGLTFALGYRVEFSAVPISHEARGFTANTFAVPYPIAPAASSAWEDMQQGRGRPEPAGNTLHDPWVLFPVHSDPETIETIAA